MKAMNQHKSMAMGKGLEKSPKAIAKFAKGGAVMKHDDVKEDKAMIKKMVKPAALTGKKMGGKACK